MGAVPTGAGQPGRLGPGWSWARRPRRCEDQLGLHVRKIDVPDRLMPLHGVALTCWNDRPCDLVVLASHVAIRASTAWLQPLSSPNPWRGKRHAPSADCFRPSAEGLCRSCHRRSASLLQYPGARLTIGRGATVRSPWPPSPTSPTYLGATGTPIFHVLHVGDRLPRDFRFRTPLERPRSHRRHAGRRPVVEAIVEVGGNRGLRPTSSSWPTRGHDSLARHPCAGSTTEQVLRHSERPVLAVPA